MNRRRSFIDQTNPTVSADHNQTNLTIGRQPILSPDFLRCQEQNTAKARSSTSVEKRPKWPQSKEHTERTQKDTAYNFLPAVVTPLALLLSCHLKVEQPVSHRLKFIVKPPPEDSRGKSVWIALLSSSREPASTVLTSKSLGVESTFLSASLCL